jgi:hypothetical protein
MRLAKLGLALLAVTLVAADPFVGTWKLNLEQSGYSAGFPTNGQTVVISETGGDLDVTIIGTSADGTRSVLRYATPVQGGQGKVVESRSVDRGLGGGVFRVGSGLASPVLIHKVDAGSFETVSAERTGPKEREVNFSKSGRIVLTVRSRVSPDDKAMTVTVKGADAAGKALDGRVSYDKQ